MQAQVKECGDYDIIIIGCGITGATIARELSRYKARTAVLERASDIPFGASRANSSMIHGGFDDEPGTAKAKFCPKGNRMYHSLSEELDFKLREFGSFVCAKGGQDERHLEMLYDQGKANGALGIEIVSGDKFREKEPNTASDITAALWCSSGAIVNNFEAALAFIENARQNGVDLFMETEVTGLLFDETRSAMRGVSTNRGNFNAPVVINASGVYADVISRMAGDDGFIIHPTRGEYFIFDRSVGDLVTSFLFSCPSEYGKGVTVTHTADDNLLIGPTSVQQTDRENRNTTPMGLDEAFDGARRLVPGIPRNMVITTFSGVRANTNTGDFYIKALDSPRGFINVAGIKSPGFTSAPAIAEHIGELIKDSLGDVVKLENDPAFVPTRKHIPRFIDLPMKERDRLASGDSRWGQIVCRCESVTEAQVVEAIRRGARTVAGVKLWVRPGTGRCQGGFCAPRVVEILARELGTSPLEITRHGGDSHMLTGRTKDPLLPGEPL
ncbi:MAG: NAD(P)/FAD-dependent oxidoreductase [Synergistaceae bacterium]|nr:NAD(P)/FAD-dependent oxidoreductase [Synergistaceae bacterium]